VTLLPIILGWRPLIEPLPLDDPWLWLMIPLVLSVSIVYKAIKLEDMSKLPRQALELTSQFILLMALAAAILWVLTELA